MGPTVRTAPAGDLALSSAKPPAAAVPTRAR